MVGALFAADTLNCIFDMWWIYDILINHFSASDVLLCEKMTYLTHVVDLNALSTGNWSKSCLTSMIKYVELTPYLQSSQRVNAFSIIVY